jgi:isoaspartyl peptidase/L-asparaginase-like protein (Ntn-hydrolase superfamily)
VPSPSIFFQKEISIFIGLCTGAGEYIVRANLARSIADALNRASATDADEDVDVHEVLQRVLAEEFWSILYSSSSSKQKLTVEI